MEEHHICTQIHCEVFLTCQVEISEDNAGQEAVHVELDTTVLHVLCDDGFHGAESQHTGLMDLPPSFQKTQHDITDLRAQCFHVIVEKNKSWEKDPLKLTHQLERKMLSLTKAPDQSQICVWSAVTDCLCELQTQVKKLADTSPPRILLTGKDLYPSLQQLCVCGYILYQSKYHQSNGMNSRQDSWLKSCTFELHSDLTALKVVQLSAEFNLKLLSSFFRVNLNECRLTWRTICSLLFSPGQYTSTCCTWQLEEFSTFTVIN